MLPNRRTGSKTALHHWKLASDVDADRVQYHTFPMLADETALPLRSEAPQNAGC